MAVRRKLIPVAALALAIGASAAGAATASATTTNTNGDTDKGQGSKPVCTIVIGGGTTKKGFGDEAGAAAVREALKAMHLSADGAAAKAAGRAAAAAGEGRIVVKGGQPSDCKKRVEKISLDTAAAKLGVSKAALVQALTETKQWIISSGTKPSVAQFEQHLADQLHIPVAKLAGLLDPAAPVAKPGA